MNKKFKMTASKALCVLFAFILLALPALAEISSAQVEDARIEAEAQAARDTNKILWFAVGCFGGPVGIAIAYLIESKAPQAVLLGKSPDYVASYTDAYTRKSKSIRTTYGLYGCGASVVLYGLLYLVAFGTAASTTTLY
jgi:hypothetical protein